MGTDTPAQRARRVLPEKQPVGEARSLPTILFVPAATAQAVLQAVCDPSVFDMPIEQIIGPARFGGLPDARAIVVFVLRNVWGDPAWTGEPPKGWATLAQVGLVVKRDHTTAYDAIQRLVPRCRKDPYLLAQTIKVLDLLAERVAERDVSRVNSVRRRLEELCRN